MSLPPAGRRPHVSAIDAQICPGTHLTLNSREGREPHFLLIVFISNYVYAHVGMYM